MHLTLHHLKLYKPTKTKLNKIELLSKNWNKAIRSALKIVKHWGFTAYTKSHKQTYRVLRNNYKLPSQVANEANRKAVEVYKVNENSNFNRIVPVRLVHKKSFEIINNEGKYFAKILTPNKDKVYCPLSFGEYQLNYLEDDNYKIKTAQLYKSNNEWYLDLTLEYEQPKRDTDTTLGIDLGIINLATFSILDEDQNILHTEHISGEQLRFKRMRYKQKRKAKARSSGSLKTSLIKENQICKQLNWKIANRIVNLADKYNSKIVFEDLKNIRKNITNGNTLNNYEKNNWAFYQLKQFIKHKANLKGLPVEEINPKNTSQTCSVCDQKGFRSEYKQDFFKCANGHILNADSNASINIAKKAI
ncbi:transposase [Natroniella sulfidigena]|uniref:RNA-guided endonuclease InsQ/TnpB family protein n=1 Tax=Natroniella sulfidigena TaxID=723921 RepID=UPI00200ACFC0|nr:transposase [Natroniella sulfidigena]MCK8818054.1 transposase [Natroniella sulfidigena]